MSWCKGEKTIKDPVLMEFAVNGEEGHRPSDLVLWVVLTT